MCNFRCIRHVPECHRQDCFIHQLWSLASRRCLPLSQKRSVPCIAEFVYQATWFEIGYFLMHVVLVLVVILIIKMVKNAILLIGMRAGDHNCFLGCKTQERLTTASLKSCTMTYTGSMWQIESDINWASSCTDVSMARLRGTLSTVARRSPMFSGQPHINWWWCHDTGSPLLTAEHSLCRVWQSGTLCLMTFVLLVVVVVVVEMNII